MHDIQPRLPSDSVAWFPCLVLSEIVRGRRPGQNPDGNVDDQAYLFLNQGPHGVALYHNLPDRK